MQDAERRLKADELPADAADEIFLTSKQVQQRYSVTGMSVYRWENDAATGFPAPTYFGRWKRYRLSELVAWERSRARGKARSA